MFDLSTSVERDAFEGAFRKLLESVRLPQDVFMGNGSYTGLAAHYPGGDGKQLITPKPK